MRISSLIVFIQLMCTSYCIASDEINEAANKATKLLELSTKLVDAKERSDKIKEAKTNIDKIFETIKGKVYTDDELSPLYHVRGLSHFMLYQYDDASKDFVEAVKLNSKNLNSKIMLSLIKSSAPDEKLRNGKEALAIAQDVANSIRKIWDESQRNKNAYEGLSQKLNLIQINGECAKALAKANAELGNFKESITILKGQEDEKLKGLIEQFRNMKPYRLPTHLDK